MIVIVFGLPGSGKSYFASRLAKKINAGYVNSDKVRKEMFAKRTYSDQEKNAVYAKMVVLMKEAARQDTNLVLDATFHRKEVRKMFVEELEGESKVWFIEVRADEDIIKERMKEERPYSEADFKVYKHILQQYEPLDKPHLILESTNDNIIEMLERAIKYLKAKNDN